MKKQTNNNRELAQILFLQGGLQKKDIAEKLGVSQQTITNWAKADNWDALKKNLLTGKKRILSQLYDELSEFNRMIEDRQGYKVATSKEADARRKLIKDIKDEKIAFLCKRLFKSPVMALPELLPVLIRHGA